MTAHIKRGSIALVSLVFFLSPLSPLVPLLHGRAAADGLTPVDLGADFIPIGISDSGVVAGNFRGTYPYYDDSHPAIWQSGTVTNLALPSGVTGGWASSMNSATGEIVGYSYTIDSSTGQEIDRAAKWSSSGTLTQLGGPPSSSSCDTTTGSTIATAVNDSGDIAGYCINQDYSSSAGSWPDGSPNSFTELPAVGTLYQYQDPNTSAYWSVSQATGINHDGQIVGASYVTCPCGFGASFHATLWQNGTAIGQDITPAGSEGQETGATAINDHGLAGGFISASFNAYVWDLANNRNYDLSALTGGAGFSDGLGSRSHGYVGYPDAADAVNNDGTVLGATIYGGAYMWKAGSTLTNLITLLPSDTDWYLGTAYAINSSGQIVGIGGLNSQANVTHGYLLNASAPTQLSYLAMGDSFASGEGAHDQDYFKGTDEPLNNCHLSKQSYPYLLANDLGISSANVHSVACSGARTMNVTSSTIQTTGNPDLNPKIQHDTYSQITDNSLGTWLPGYKTQEKYIEDNYTSTTTPNVITISDGGNDIGFVDILEKCIEPGGDCYSHYNDRLGLANEINDVWFPRWVKLYNDIRTNKAPGAKIYVIGYPSVISTSSLCYPNTLGFATSSNNRQFANDLTAYLNDVISLAAESAGVQYVDVTNSLVGHRLCENINPFDIAVNGYTPGEDNHLLHIPIGDESFHPNDNGHKLMGAAILSATHGFTQKMPDGPDSSINPPSLTNPDTPFNNFLSAPNAGGPSIDLYDYIPNMTTGGQNNLLYFINGAIHLTTKGAQKAKTLAPLSTFAMSINSDPIDLGTVTSDSNGDLDTTVTIPSTVTPGFHRIDIVGPDTDGQTVDIQSGMIFVAASSTDYLGDGTPNSAKTCLFVPQSGTDANQDGIDDACEGYIGNLPLYKAVYGDASQSQDPSKIYIERNESVASSLGITDYNPSNAQWVVVGHTTSSDDASSTIANFTIDDTGVNPPTNYLRYIPHLSTMTTDNDCVELTPASLAPLTSTSTTAMSLVATHTDTCSPGTITPRASASANNSSGSTSLTINAPSGTVAGDTMIAHVVVQTSGNSIAAPSGWHMIKRQDTSTNLATATYYKVAGSSEPSSYTWNFGTSGEASGGIAAYSGVDTTNPIDANDAQYNNGTANLDNAGLATTVDNDLLVYAAGIVNPSTSVTQPTGFTQQWKANSSTATSSVFAQEAFPTLGNTGLIHGTLGSNYSSATQLIALRPAGDYVAPPSGIALSSSSADNNGSGSTSLTISSPSKTQSGDVLVAHVVVQTAANSIAAPTGWHIIKRQDTSSYLSTATYYKVAGSSEPSSYTWTFGTSGQASGSIGDYVGVNTTTPIDTSNTQYNNGVSTVDNAGVTTAYANEMLVDAVGVIRAASVQPPSGFTEGAYSASNANTASQLFDEISSSASATGTIHTTMTIGTYSTITQLIALVPADATPPTPPSGISLRSSSANTTGSSSSSLTLNVPAGTQSGDVMVAHVVVRTAGNTITAPTGWTQIVRKDTGSALSTVAYYKVASSSEPASYTWNFGTSGEASGSIGSYIGVNNAAPVDVSNGQLNSSSNNVDNSGVTTTVANDMLVYAAGVVQATSVVPPSGFSEGSSSASNSLTTAEVSNKIDTSSGATGTIHGTENGGTAYSNVTLLIALKPN